MLEASPGEILVLETLDAASGRIRKASDIYSYEKVRSPETANPATGPIFVKGV